jgi:hypothetical protein
MERLTERMANGTVRRTDVMGESVMLRLAAYEDTGLTPEEIMTLQELHDFYNSNDCLASRRLIKLALADKDGRLIIADEQTIANAVAKAILVNSNEKRFIYELGKACLEPCCKDAFKYILSMTALRKEQGDGSCENASM